MSKVKKAGCILMNTEDKTIALVLRKQTEYSFPKGHVEEGESLIDCAIRETNEETKRNCEILIPEPIYIENYITPGGEDVIMYYFLAKDIGPSNNTSEDTHPTFWFPVDEVLNKLPYSGLQIVWKSVIDQVKEYMK